MKRIIIIDDDPGIQDAIKLIFPPSGYDVTIYSDGTKLFENSFPVPDLFILDKQLSGIDGLDLCRLLKRGPDTKNIPIIIITASPGMERLAAEAGASMVIHKPFEIATIRSAVVKLLSPS